MRFMLLAVLMALLSLSATAQEVAPPADKATRVITAWDVVPHEVFDKTFNVGVVAFHETNCKVEFQVLVAGRAVPAYTKTVEQPTLNPQVKVWEYWMALNANDFPDGPIEVQARAVPLGSGHLTTELKAMPLYANGHGSLTFGQPVWVDGEKGDDAAAGTEAAPLKTLAAGVKMAPDGGTVYLKPCKNYSAQALGGAGKRLYWLVITPAPGVTRDEVEIGPGRPGVDKLCFRNVTLFTDPPDRKYNTILSGEQGKHIVWVDQSKMYNRKGRWEGGGTAFGNRYVPYVTGGLTTEMDGGPGGVLMRDHKIVKITSDAFTGVNTAINCSVEDIHPGKTGAHPDFHQSHVGDKTKFNSVILYNVWGKNCLSQGFFGHNLRDSAFVNCLFHKADTVMYSQYSGPLDHVLFIHISVPNQSWLWRDGFKATNCYMINSLLSTMKATAGADTAGLTIDALHLISEKEPQGVGGTNGPIVVIDRAGLDFHQTAASAAAGGGRPLQCVPADMDGNPYDAKDRSRGCFQRQPGAQPKP